LGAAKALGRRGVPSHGFIGLGGLFGQLRQLECHHGVARPLVERGKLARWVAAGFRLADACLDLSPIGHGRAL